MGDAGPSELPQTNSPGGHFHWSADVYCSPGPGERSLYGVVRIEIQPTNYRELAGIQLRPFR